MGVGYKSGAGFCRSTVCGFLHNTKDGFRIRDITKQKPYGVNVDRRSRSMRDITAFMLIGDKSVRDLTVLLLIGDKSVRDSAALMLTHDKFCLETFFNTSRMLITGVRGFWRTDIRNIEDGAALRQQAFVSEVRVHWVAEGVEHCIAHLSPCERTPVVRRARGWGSHEAHLLTFA